MSQELITYIAYGQDAQDNAFCKSGLTEPEVYTFAHNNKLVGFQRIPERGTFYRRGARMWSYLRKVNAEGHFIYQKRYYFQWAHAMYHFAKIFPDEPLATMIRLHPTTYENLPQEIRTGGLEDLSKETK